MFGVRDALWAVVVCVALIVLVQCRASWSVRAAVERDADQAFGEVYAGYRYVSGGLVADGYTDPLRPMVEVRRFEIVAERQSVTGRKAELVARNVIRLANGTPGGEDASQEAHVELERSEGRWVYTRFETRDGQKVRDPGNGNPWTRTLLARAAGAPTGPAPGEASPLGD